MREPLTTTALRALFLAVALALMPLLRGVELPRLADEAPVPIPSPRAWALAMDAMYAGIMRAPPDRLCWGPPTDVNVDAVRNELATGPWGVRDRDGTLRQVRSASAGAGAYSLEFSALCGELKPLSETERDRLVQAAAGDPTRANRLAIARAHLDDPARTALWAWDLARAISLCRRSYTAGYIQQDEAWALIMPLARTAQKRFTAWREVRDNYLLGRSFWSKTRAERGNADLHLVGEALLADPGSAWNKLPWDLDLAEPAVVP